jgi:rubredoxin
MFVCTICGFIYNPAVGDPGQGIEPGTEFRDLPETWVCPRCGAKQYDFAYIEDKPDRE